MPIEIIKASGAREVFDKNKLKRSLQKAGADSFLTQEIASYIEKRIKNEMTTKEIYRLAFSLLRKNKSSLAARYNLKKAIFELGPEGFPFEKFIGKVLEGQGYKSQVGKIIQGKCVSHEVDVIAEKSDNHFLVECKFHNQQGIKSDVKVALYVKSRFDDVQLGSHAEHKEIFHQAWLITNTKFTKDAVQYAKCVGMKITGWNYPESESLQDIIESSGLHPLTCLPFLSLHHKRVLLSKGLVLCKEITENPAALAQIGIKGDKQKQVINDIRQVCL